MSDRVRIMRAADAPARERGGGVRTTHLVTGETVPDAGFVSGITAFEPGAALTLHHHNCDESVLVLEGRARFELEERSWELGPDDATFVPAGLPHRFANVGSGRLRIFFVYDSAAPTRTMLATGETFPIGSPDDVLRPAHDP